MSKETKLCKYCQSEIPKNAKICPNCKKKQEQGVLSQIFSGCLICFLGLFLAIFGIIFVEIFLSNVKKAHTTAVKTGTVDGIVSDSGNSESVNNRFNVGDIIETSDLRISYISADVYYSDNQYITPKDGYEFYRFEFKVENISDSDQYVSDMIGWECYADNSNMEQSFYFDDDLSATLSSGREMQGSVYFEVPVDSQSIELEYDINYWKSDKIIFIGK